MNTLIATTWQEEMISSLRTNRYTVVEQDRCLGISTGVMLALLYKAFQRPGSANVVIYPNSQMSDNAWRTAGTVAIKLGVAYEYRKRDRQLSFGNGSSIRFASVADSFDIHRGINYTSVFFENADLMRERQLAETFTMLLPSLHEKISTIGFTYTNYCPFVINLETHPDIRSKVNKIMVLDGNSRQEFKKVSGVDFQADLHMIG